MFDLKVKGIQNKSLFKPVVQLLVLFWLFLDSLNLTAQDAQINIIPEPQRVTFFDESFIINKNTRIVTGNGSTELDNFTINRLIEHFHETAGIQLNVVHEDEVTNHSNIIYLGKLETSALARKLADKFDTAAKIEIGQEGYCLQSSDSLLIITAHSSQGLFYGCETLKQLLHKNNGRLQVTGLTIYDWPDFQFRGISLDLSRGQVPNSGNFKKIIRFLSKYKMNTCMLYLGSRFRFESHPKIAKGRGALSRSEVTDLEEFANNYHIQIIPIIETLTNMEEILMLPEYIDLAEYPGATSITLLNDKSVQLMDDLLFEVAEAFQSPYLHVGGRQNHQIGWHSDKAAVENNDLTTRLVEHYKHVVEKVKQYDKQVIMCSEKIFSNPALLYQLPKEITYVNANSDIKKFSEDNQILNSSNRKYMVAPVLWNGHSILPDYFSALPTIRNMIKSGYETGASGVITSNWNSGYGFTFPQFNFHSYAFAAECSWSTRSTELNSFSNKFFKQYYGTNAKEPGLIYNLLADIAEISSWDAIWRHPLLFATEPFHIAPALIFKLKTRMQLVLNMIETSSNDFLRNREQLDYLKFAAKQAAWLAKKIQLIYDIKQLSQNFHKFPTNSEAHGIIESCFEIVEDLNEIEEDLQLLWMRSYQVEDLPELLDLYGLQKDYWQEIIRHFQAGHFHFDPLLESQWIYYPAHYNEGQSTEHAFFRKTFDVAAGFKKAFLQAIADSHLKVYLNGGFLGEVIFVDRNSFRSNVKSAVIWDISALLRPGINVLAVEARNYQPENSAGLNIFGQIEYEFGKTIDLHSDAYWKTSNKEMQNWQNLGFFDLQWLNAEPRAKNLTIIQPDFKMARPSIIEWK